MKHNNPKSLFNRLWRWCTKNREEMIPEFKHRKLVFKVALALFGILILFTVLTDHPRSSEILTLNTDKTAYALNETVKIRIISLNKDGKHNCNSNLQLVAKGSFWRKYRLPVISSPSCSSDIATNDPDYGSTFNPIRPGKYRLVLINKDNNETVTADINVSKQMPKLGIKRSGATRVNTNGTDRYPMIITLTAKEDYKGKVTDVLPEGFSFAWYGTAEIDDIDGSKTISWPIDLKAGESTELKYEYIPAGSENMTRVIGPVIYSEGSKTNIGSEWIITTGGL